MGKFCGKIGFLGQAETSPGVWSDVITERIYYGDVKKQSRKYQNVDGVDDTFTLRNTFSIIADSYANENLHVMKWIEYAGIKWSIKSIDIDRPRLEIIIGGEYHG